MRPLSMVYGGGGIFGIGYCVGVAHGLASGGIPVDAAPALGTSAGSWAASAVALGIDAETIMSIEAPRIPNRSRGLLAEIARSIFGERSHPSVSVSAVCVRSRKRHILDGGAYPLADLIAASSAVPGLLPAHRIDGRLYVDGGMSSATSVEAAAPARTTIVIAPLAGGPMGLIGRGAGFLLGREMRSWRTGRPDRSILMIRPNREIASHVGFNPMDLFDADRGRAVYPLAVEQGRRLAERIGNVMPELVSHRAGGGHASTESDPTESNPRGPSASVTSTPTGTSTPQLTAAHPAGHGSPADSGDARTGDRQLVAA